MVHRRLVFDAYRLYMRSWPFALGRGFAHRLVARLAPATYRVAGTTFELNPAAWIDRDLINGAPHDPLVLDAIEAHLAQGGVFLDVGANFGLFSLLAAAKPGVSVHAFEPSPRELRRLHRNLAANQDRAVAVHPVALGERNEELVLHLSSALNPGMNSLLDRADGTVRSVRCRCVRLDGYLAAAELQRVRLVKIDVEGFELGVLRGLAAAMPQLRRAAFVVEVTPSLLEQAGGSARELYEFFAGYGYSWRTGLNSEPQWNEWFTPPEAAPAIVRGAAAPTTATPS
jgi:FkbM family methyltransferase